MDLVQLMRKARTLLELHWILAIGVYLVYAVMVPAPAEFDSYGEIISFLLAGSLQLGLCFFFLNLVKGKEIRFKLLFEGFKPLATLLLAYSIITGLTVVGFISLIFPGILVALGFFTTYYIIAEDPEISF